MLQVDADAMCTTLFNQEGRIRLKCKVAGSVLLFNSMAILLYFPCCPTESVCIRRKTEYVPDLDGHAGRMCTGSPSSLQVGTTFLLRISWRKEECGKLGLGSSARALGIRELGLN